MTETELLKRFIPRAVELLPVRLFRRQIMLARTDDGRTMRAGIKGQADVWGFTFPGGRHIEIEAKAAHGRLRPEQQAWKTFCEQTGMVYMLAEAASGEPADATVLRWIEELRQKL